MQVSQPASRKAKYMTQVLVIKKAVYSSAGNLRRWWTPALKNHLNSFYQEERESRTKKSEGWVVITGKGHGRAISVRASFNKDLGVSESLWSGHPGPIRIWNCSLL